MTFQLTWYQCNLVGLTQRSLPMLHRLLVSKRKKADLIHSLQHCGSKILSACLTHRTSTYTKNYLLELRRTADIDKRLVISDH